MSRIICIDPGHGGKDPGAVNGKYQEKNFTLDIAKKLAFFLEIRDEFEIIFTRTEDAYVSLQDRCDIANRYNCDLFISIHINSAADSDAYGIETLCYEEIKSKKLAYNIQKALINATKAKDRGVKVNNSLYVLNTTKMTAILAELGFISNYAELFKLEQDDYQNKMAEAIALGICGYFQIQSKNKVFVTGSKRYKTIDEIPEYARESIKEMCDTGAIKGDGESLDLSEDMLRLIVIFDRYLKKRQANDSK